MRSVCGSIVLCAAMLVGCVVRIEPQPLSSGQVRTELPRYVDVSSAVRGPGPGPWREITFQVTRKAVIELTDGQFNVSLNVTDCRGQGLWIARLYFNGLLLDADGRESVLKYARAAKTDRLVAQAFIPQRHLAGQERLCGSVQGGSMLGGYIDENVFQIQ